MIKIIINNRIVVVNPRFITHVELYSNKEIEIGICNRHNLLIEVSELPDATVEFMGSETESDGWEKIIKDLISK